MIGSYYKCVCGHQFSSKSFDTFPCPKCGSNRREVAIMGGRKPEWYTGPDPEDATDSPSRLSYPGA